MTNLCLHCLKRRGGDEDVLAVRVRASCMEKGLSKQGHKPEAHAMPEHPPPNTRPWRPPARKIDSLHVPPTTDCSYCSSDAPRPVPAAQTLSTTPTDAQSHGAERGKAQFVWRPSAKVPPASAKESSSMKSSSPVIGSLKAKFSYRPPAPLPDPSASSTTSGNTRATSSPAPSMSSKAPRSTSPNLFIYQPPASPSSSNIPGTLSVPSTYPKTAQTAPSVYTRVKEPATQSRFDYRPHAPGSYVAFSVPSTLSASPSPPSSTISNPEVREVRIKCSKCGSRSHLWKDCPDNGNCACCWDPENKQPCATVMMRTRMMKVCRNNGDLPQMRNLLKSLKIDGHKPTVHSYSVLLSLLVLKGQMEKAQEIWKTMDEDGVVADTICYNTLLNGWCSAGRLGEAKAVLTEMKGRQLQLTTSTYNTLLKGFGLAGQAAEAMKLLQQMTSEGIAKPNKQTYNILVNAWAQVKDVEQARRVLQLMRNAGFAPDVVTYNTIAKAYAELRRTFEAERVITEMQDAYIRPNERTYGIVLNSYCQTGRPEEGLALLDRMRMDGVRCNLAIFNILIKGFAELYQSENVDKVLSLMDATGVKPDVQSFSLVMNVWCSVGLVEEARAIFERMQKVYVLRPDVTAYTILAKGYARARRPAEAEGILSEMINQGLKPNVFTYTTVLSGWCNVGNMEDAFRVFKDMQTRGVSPNSNTVSTLIWGFSESKQPQRAEEVLEATKRAGYNPDRNCREQVAEAWRAVGLPAEARRVLRGESTAEAIPDESSLRTRFDSMIARREIALDSNIYKELIMDPKPAITISSRSQTQIASNSMRPQRVTRVATKTGQQALRSPKTSFLESRHVLQTFNVCDIRFVKRMEGLKSRTPATVLKVEPQAKSTVNRGIEKRVFSSAGASSTRTSWIPVFIL